MFLLQREALFRRFFELAKFPFVSHIGYPLLQLLIDMSEAVEPAVPDEEVLLGLRLGNVQYCTVVLLR